MRLDKLQAVLTTLRLKQVPQNIVLNSTLSSLIYLGISDEDLIKFVAPKIIDLELRGECSTKNLKQFIQEHKEIKLLPDPIRQMVNNSARQRRMDSLSRLLSLDNKYTPCIAVTFYKGEIIVSSNAPREEMTDDLLSNHLLKKLSLIQEFLNDLTKNIHNGSKPDIQKIQFSIQTKLAATEAVLKITAPSLGGVGDIIPNTKAKRHKNRNNKTAHLQNALLKLAEYCLLGLYTNGKTGFTLEEISALMGKNITTLTPNQLLMNDKKLHAEQSILHYLNAFTDFRDNLLAQVYIGISKLCCQACDNVLKRENKLSYRGTHGINFSSVYDLNTLNFFEGKPTNMRADTSPEDSESECELDSDNKISDDKKIRPVTTFIHKDIPKPQNQISNYTLFKSNSGADKSLSIAKSDVSIATENIFF